MCLCLHRGNKEALIKHMQSVGFSSFLGQQSQRSCSCDIQHVNKPRAIQTEFLIRKRIGKKGNKFRADTEDR